MSEDFDLRIEGPLPIDIVSNLTQALAAVYPNTTTGASARPYGETRVTYTITAHDRENPQPPGITDPTGLTPAQEGMDLLAMSASGTAWTMPEWIGRMVIPMFRSTLEMFPEAENYLEQQFTVEDDPIPWVALILRPEGKTPHELRRVAEARVAELERQLAELQPKEDAS